MRGGLVNRKRFDGRARGDLLGDGGASLGKWGVLGTVCLFGA